MSASPHTSTFVAGDGAGHPLVLLHGSNGTESDLLPLADRLSPGAATLGVRGTLPLDEGYAFFHRHRDRRIDEVDLTARVQALARLLQEQIDSGRFRRDPVVVGFSNGAIMAAALAGSVPASLAGAVLFRALSPFTSDDAYRPSDLPVLVIDGSLDDRRSPADGRRLAGRLRRAGASVTHHVLPTGHALTTEDEALARAWLTSLPTPVRRSQDGR